MKKILLIAAVMTIYSATFSQDMKGMDMPKPKEKGSDNMDGMNMPKTATLKVPGKAVAYYLDVTDTLVTFAKGKLKPAIAINGTIPAPTLYFTKGDTAIIHVRNLMKEETSIHWHGLLLPNEADGVPYLTTPPIEPGSTYTFSFPVIQNGTYWYHSHTALQEQVGLYGGIVIYPADKMAQKEKVILFSDWTNEDMSTVVRSLKAGYEWYGIKRNSVQSWGEALVKGYLGDKAKQEWGRMPPMDVSDVYYNAFLANGRQSSEYPEFKPGETILLRLINGAAGSYFNIQFAGGPMTVVAADGIDVRPVKIDKIDFPIAETYDVLITIPAEGAYELRATAADISGYSSVYFGSGKKVAAPNIPALDYFAMLRERNKMDMAGSGKKGTSMEGMDMGNEDKKSSSVPGMDMRKKEDEVTKMDGMDMGSKKEATAATEKSDMAGMKMDNGKSAGTLTYDMLRSIQPTAFDENLSVRTVPLTLTGNMIRYIWSFDDKPLSKSDNIMIKKGEVVRFKMFNNTMMRHPMHLHGHFFRLINAQGDYSPLKHTFDIQPMETVTIEFLANEEKDWFFHCHILYHLVAGMARIVSYEGSEQNEFAKTGYKELKKEDNAIYKWGDLNVLSNGAFLESFVSNNKTQFRFEGRVNWKGNFETEAHLLRFIDKQDYFAAFIGYDYRRNKEVITDPKDKLNTKDNRRQFEVGLIYLLPFFVEAEVRADPTGRFRAQLQRRDMPITTRIFFDGKINTDKEYLMGLRYFFSRTFSISALYDSDYGVGAGISIRY
ncbi:multicopper oxidase domain-containing protein [Dyadobacter psychrotolerans]|uniref:Copper oxidase n=1 Tax=Dyadobacter psychrotolerans TaxID=2541721 RepID=A0A4R5DBQ0_9BACT|nr:multicopper oxidase domain-containing protein [Dyadobacter psychrotolerans]TDE09410.1 copper oxidase [Dyadobacter psychrotolerans]